MQEIFDYLSKIEFSFYLLICSFIFVFFAGIIKQKNIRLLLLSLFGITISLFLFEILFAIHMPILVSRKNNSFSIDNLDTETIKVRATIREIEKNDKEQFIYYQCKIYSNFFRYTESNLNSNDGFVFLGCSFTYGAGLYDKETLPYYFSQLYNFDKLVINCSMGGRGTNFAFNIMESDFVYKFNKDVKIKYFIYSVIQDQINRNFNVSTFYLNDDNFILKNGNFIRAKEPLGFLKVIFKKSYIFHRFFIDFINNRNKEFYKQYFINTLIKMKNLAIEKYNAELIVVLWPDIEQQIIEKLKKENINTIVLNKKFEEREYKIIKDDHPNAKANKEIAQILFDYINNK